MPVIYRNPAGQIIGWDYGNPDPVEDIRIMYPLDTTWENATLKEVYDLSPDPKPQDTRLMDTPGKRCKELEKHKDALVKVLEEELKVDLKSKIELKLKEMK